MKVLLKILFYIALLTVLGFLLVQLFFQEEFETLKEQYFHSSADEEVETYAELTIAYSFGPEDLDPVHSDAVTRQRIQNIYEKLVGTDRNLNFQPSLALSWGRRSDTEWEFKLRPNVVFHDGSNFDADDVIASFTRALNSSTSDLKDVLSTIESIKKVDDLTVLITTKRPDPILVNRIGTVLIFPSEKKSFQVPVGTGPYKFISFSEDEMVLERFESYWGESPYYSNVTLKTIPNRFERLDSIKNGEIDILANVPPSFAQELNEHQSVSIDSRPSLEVNFLIFNFETDLLQDKRIREAIALTFDKRVFVEFSNGYAEASNQYVSNGVFGFNPDIEDHEQDQDYAKRLVREYDLFKRPSVSIDMSEGTQVIGEYIKEQLNEIGISANINILTFDELREKIANKESEIYYLGWRSEIGDASDFYENAVHSKGSFNGGNYLSKKVDQLIELSLQNLDQQKRVEQLHTIMRIIVEEDIIGVPLFETEIIYGIRAGIRFKPRLDGYIYAAEIS